MSENRRLLNVCNSSAPVNKVLTLNQNSLCRKQLPSNFWVLPAYMLAQTHLIKGPYRVYFGLDFALTVQVNQLGYNTSDKLKFFIHISKVVATYSLVMV